MSQVIDVSSKLGEYMLKGWVLTDRICPTTACNVPLLRSPNGAPLPSTYLCANCGKDTTAPTLSPPDVVSATPTSPGGSSPHYSRSSTPPTEVSSGLSSPTFAPPVETAETRRRREQSDRASAEIGKKLLQGYAMLADECPNQRCYGVPLVRPPRTGPEKDPRKQCVICARTYIDERDADGFEHLVTKSIETSAGATGSSSKFKESNLIAKAVKGKDKEQAGLFIESQPASSSRTKHAQLSGLGEAFQEAPASSLRREDASLSSSPSIVPHSITTLETALQALAQRMTLITSSPATMDVTAVKIVAESMSSVAQALEHVNGLQRGA